PGRRPSLHRICTAKPRDQLISRREQMTAPTPAALRTMNDSPQAEGAKMDERDVLRIWRELFPNKDVTPEALAKADTLLDGLSGESPLHLRLANELAELKKLPDKEKRARRPAAKSAKKPAPNAKT